MNIIQFGVNDAVDEVFNFCQQISKDIDHAIFLDANPFALEKAIERYKTILPEDKTLFIHQAIVCDPSIKGKVQLYYPKNEIWSGHSSLFKDITKINWNDLESIEVESTTPDKILNMLPKIDYLFIDVEGLDADIILYIDFDKYKIPFIVFESAHSDGYFKRGDKYLQCINKLKKYNYIISNQNLDTYAVLPK